ncbi:GMP synthase (glutamine-hydrolyzing) [Savitreella phatthalungensis]
MSDIANTDRQDEGVANAHKDIDNKDQRSLANRVEAEKKHEKEEEERANLPGPDPRQAALDNGNEPSRGAKIDAAIEQEEAAELAKKEEAKAQAAAAKK